jgi:hypothetical protein
MPSLEDALAKAFAPIVAELARRTAEVLQAMSVEELLAFSGLERRAKQRGRAKAGAQPKAKVNASAAVDGIMALLRKSGDGMSAEAIKAVYPMNRGAWRSVSAALLATGQVSRKGNKRATTYHLASGAQTRKSPTTSSRKRSGRTKAK